MGGRGGAGKRPEPATPFTIAGPAGTTTLAPQAALRNVIADHPHTEFISLEDLRAALPGLSKPDQDRHIIALVLAETPTGNLQLIPESNQKVLSQAQRDARIHAFGQDKDFLWVTAPPGWAAKQRTR